MPGEFYVEGKAAKVSLQEVLARLDEILAKLGEAAGVVAEKGSTTADWNAAESDVVSIGESGSAFRLHSLLVSVHNLAGTAVTVRMYMYVNGAERKVYEQAFDATSDPPGLWLVNGTVGIHEVLRATLESNDPADDGKAIDYDFMLEAM